MCGFMVFPFSLLLCSQLSPLFHVPLSPLLSEESKVDSWQRDHLGKRDGDRKTTMSSECCLQCEEENNLENAIVEMGRIKGEKERGPQDFGREEERDGCFMK